MAKTPAKEEQTLATQSENTGLMDVPDWLKDKKSARGTEAIEASDMTMPRLALCQSGTPQRKKANPKFIEGLQEGQFFNTLTGQIYGETVNFVPLFFYKSRIMFKDLDDGGGILCMSHDGVHCPLNNGGACLHQDWGADGKQPDCTELYNFAVVLPATNEMVVLSLKSTGIKVAKDLNSMIRMRRRDAFTGVYTLGSAAAKSGENDYFAHTLKNAGWIPPEMFPIYEALYNDVAPKVKSGEMTMDTSGMTPSEEAFAARDAEGDSEL